MFFAELNRYKGEMTCLLEPIHLSIIMQFNSAISYATKNCDRWNFSYKHEYLV